MSLVARAVGKLAACLMELTLDNKAQLNSGEGSREALFQTALVLEALHTHKSVPRGLGEPGS